MTDSSLKKAKQALLLAQANMDIITDSPDEFEFRFLGATKGSEKVPATYGQIKAIRRYLHLNFPVNALVYQDGIAFVDYNEDGSPVENPLAKIQDPKALDKVIPQEAELTARFLLTDRTKQYAFKRGEYENLLLEPNPTYEKVNPKLKQNITDTYDNVDENTIDNTFDLKEFTQQGTVQPNVVVTGKVFKSDGTSLTRKEINEAVVAAGCNPQDSVSGETDLLVMGSNPGGNKIKAAKKKQVRIVSGETFVSELESTGAVVVEPKEE